MPQSNNSDFISDLLKASTKKGLLTAESEILLSRRVSASIPLRDKNPKELTLKERIILSNGNKAREQMIVCNVKLAYTYARKYSSMLTAVNDFSDIFQEAMLGVVRAVDGFDSTKGYKFSTYAVRWITHKIHRYIQKTNNTIRMPVHIADKYYRIPTTRTRLTAAYGRPPTASEIAKELDVDIQELELMGRLSHLSALEWKLSDEDSTTLHDIVADQKEEGHGEESQFGQIIQALEILPKRHAEMLIKAYGLFGEKRKTKAEIGIEYGATRKTVTKIISLSESRIKEYIQNPDTARESIGAFSEIPNLDEWASPEKYSQLKYFERKMVFASMYSALLKSGMIPAEASSFLKFCGYGVSYAEAEALAA